MDDEKKALLAVLFFFFLALGVRLALMGIRPLHHDEGVNGYFISNIVEGRGWKYDAENYHGPTFFYITAIFFLVFGGNVFALRIVPVLFGCLLVLVPFLLRKRLGFWGVFVSAFFLAFSPALLYYSMDAIHEILFTFFMTASLVLLLEFAMEKKAWMLFAGSACLAMLFATKEAAFIIGPFIVLLSIAFAFAKGNNAAEATGSKTGEGNRMAKAGRSRRSRAKIAALLAFALVILGQEIFVLGMTTYDLPATAFIAFYYLIAMLLDLATWVVIVLAFIVLYSLLWFLEFLWANRDKTIVSFHNPLAGSFRTTQTKLGIFFAAAGIFLLVYIPLFTSFFQNWNGLEDAVKAVSLWGPRVVTEKGHEKPFQYYAGLLLFCEAPLLLAGIGGMLLAFWKRNAFFCAFGFFFLAMFFGISAVPYKTPWIVINFLPPLALLAGFLAKEFFGAAERKQKVFGFAAIAVAFAAVLWLSYYVNVLTPAAERSEDNPLVYVQTTMKAGAVFERALNAKGKILIAMENESTWPMPWLLKNKKVEYYGKDSLESAEFLRGFEVLIVHRGFGETVAGKIPGYERTEFDLRPGVPLEAFFAEKQQIS